MNRLAFPFGVAANGRIATVPQGSDAHVKQMLLLLIMTMTGERVMRPDFGCGIHDLVFGAISAALLHRVEREVEDALRQFEARIANKRTR